MKKSITIDGVGYRLRAIGLEDAELIIDIRLEDPERNKFINPISRDVCAQKDWIEEYLKRDNDFYFVIENKLNNEAEGLISIYNIKDNRAEWGRWVVRKKSFAAIESVDLICKIAFEQLGLLELYCRTISENKQVIAFHDNLPQKKREAFAENAMLGNKIYNVTEHYIPVEYYHNTLKSTLEHKAIMIFQRNFRVAFGKMEFHHIGLACVNIEKEFTNYRMLGYIREDETFVDEKQGIKGQFIVAPNQPRLELLENLPGSTTLDFWLKNHVKMYHLAYKIENINALQNWMHKYRVKTITPMKYSSYFKKQICFMILPNMQMIELIEA